MKNFIKQFKWFILGGIIAIAGTVFAVAQPSFAPSLLPLKTDTYYLGSTSPNLEWNGLYVKNITVSGSCTGCGGGGSGNGFAFPFTMTTAGSATYAGTSTTLKLDNGILVTASSTFSNPNATTTFASNILVSTTNDSSFGFNSWNAFNVVDNQAAGPLQINIVNRNTGASGGEGIFLGNSKATNAGFSSTYYTGLFQAGSGFALYPGVLPDDMVVVTSDSNLRYAALSTNLASSTMTWSVGPGFTSANYDMALIPTTNGTGFLGVGTSSPKWLLTTKATTTPQIALGGTDTDNIWTLRGIGNTFSIATASPTTYATSSVSALKIDSNGFLTIPSNSGVGCAQFTATGLLNNTGTACGSGGSNSFAWPFTASANYVSTSTDLGLKGFFTTSSSTLGSAVHIPLITSSFLGTDSLGNMYGLASSSIKLSTLNNDSAFISTVSADSPLSGSGTPGSHLVLSTAGAWSGTAGSLAANGTNCATGFFPLGVDASGNSETCSSPFDFTGRSYGVSTSSAIGLLGGFFSTASSTISSSLHLPLITSSFLGTDSLGNVYGLATSSIALSTLNNDLASLTATNASLTFSGAYNGSAARTVGLNVGNTNTWTVNQNFNYSSSTIYSSFITASSTFLNAGSLTLSTTSAGCAAFMSSGLLTSIGSPCGSGGGSGTVSSGGPNMLAFYSANGTTVVATSSNPLYVDALYATSTATSTIKNLGGVLDATAFAGADIGAKINTAYAALPATGGIITVPSGNYPFTTKINFNTSKKPVLLSCAPGGATTLNWTTTTTSTSTVFNAIPANYQKAGWGVENCEFIGQSGGSGNSTIGIEIGGSNGSMGFTMKGVKVSKFGIGATIGNNAYNIQINTSQFSLNGRSIVSQCTANCGETWNFTNDWLVDNEFAGVSDAHNCLDFSTGNLADLIFTGGSMDDCQLLIGSGVLNYLVDGVHFENPEQGTLRSTYEYIYVNNSSFTYGNVNNSEFMQSSTTVPASAIYNGGSLGIDGNTVTANGSGIAFPSFVLNSASGTGGNLVSKNFHNHYNGSNFGATWLADGQTLQASGVNGIVWDFVSIKNHSWIGGFNQDNANNLTFYNGGSARTTLDVNGNLGIATTAPKWKLAVASTSQPQIALLGNNTDDIWTMRSIGNQFAIATASPTTYATSSKSALIIDTNGNLGIGTTTLGSLLSIGGNGTGINFADNATSTFSGKGINILNGCFAIKGICVSGGGGGSGTVTSVALTAPPEFSISGSPITTSGTLALTENFPLNSILVSNSTGNGIIATTSQLTVGSLLSTTTSLSTLIGGLNIGTSSVGNFSSSLATLVIASTSQSQLALEGKTTDNLWLFRSIGNSLYISTSSSVSNATSTIPVMGMDNIGNVFFGTNAPAQESGQNAFVTFQNATTSSSPGDAYVTFKNSNSGKAMSMRVRANSNYTHFDIVSSGAGAVAGNSSWLVGTFGDKNFRIWDDQGAGVSDMQVEQGMTAEALRITSKGQIGIGTTTPNWQLQVASSTQSGGKAFIALSDPSSGVNQKHWLLSSQGGMFFIGTSSDVYATSTNPAIRIDRDGQVFLPEAGIAASAIDYWCYNASNQLVKVAATCTVSALRFKKNITNLDVGLADLLKLRPVAYFKKDPLSPADSHQQMGFIADEVASTSPKLNELLVTYVGGGTSGEVQGFRYEQFTALITKSIQDFYGQFQTAIANLISWNRDQDKSLKKLEDENTSQQKQIDELQAEIKALKK